MNFGMLSMGAGTAGMSRFPADGAVLEGAEASRDEIAHEIFFGLLRSLRKALGYLDLEGEITHQLCE